MVAVMRRVGLLFIMVLLCYTTALGQGNVSFGGSEEAFARGMELFHAGKYAVAEREFAAVQAYGDGGVSMRMGEAAYFEAACAMRLGRGDARYKMVRFIEDYPESQRVNEARYELGTSYYRDRKYKEADEWLSQAELGAFDAEQQADILFRRGYSQFRLGKRDEAFFLFARVKDGGYYYSAPSRYYYAHIAYEQERNAVALEEFLRLEDDPTFAPIIPYYVSQIYYKQRQYDKVVEYVAPLADSLEGQRGLEMQRMLADAYFRQGKYKEAAVPLGKYVAGVETLSREDSYLVGFVFYKEGRYDEAIEHLERAVAEEDAISQNANYHLADCYLRKGDRERARKALQMAASVDFDASIQEDALFNYAKLTYELRFNPFADAVDAFMEYIKLYPDSRRVDEAYTYLGMAFTETKNYQKALEVLEKIERSSPLTRKALQRAAYFRGVELFQNLRFAEAEQLFKRSLSVADYDPTLSAQALYWHGESLYRLERYPLAANEYQKFLHSSGAFALPQYGMAPYNLGYSYFKMKNYGESVRWFRQFVDGDREKDSELRTDAYCRIGDCLYMQRHYWPAIEYYEKAESSGGTSADYALYQQGFIFGLVGRPEKKIATLSRFDAEYVGSLYRAAAFFELGQTYHSLDRLEESKRYYEKVVSGYASSEIAPSALVQLGLVCYGEGELDAAIVYLERVVQDYPGTPQMHEALAALERVYTAKGDVAPYLAYLDNIGQAQKVSQPQRDTLYFSTAEAHYMSGDCTKAIESLREYIREYPQGYASITANFYLADCLLRGRDSVSAVEPLELVVDRAPNAYFDRAQRMLCAVYEYTKEWSKALQGYDKLERMTTDPASQLEARRGKLHMAVVLGDDEKILECANALLASDKLPPELALYGRYQLAHAQLRMGRADNAYSTFALIAQNTGSVTGAEARYRMVEIRHSQRDWERTKEEVLAFSKRNTPHQYWLAKAFILLADSYHQQGDNFQAKATLQSVIENYAVADDGIIDEAKEARHKIIYDEMTVVPLRSVDTIQFNFAK